MITARSALHFRAALTQDGWRDNVRVTISGGLIESVETNVAAPAQAERHDLYAVPGIGSLHSHAFQRGMAGLAEQGGRRDDQFWSWRDVMYRFVGALTPDDVEAVTALAYMEMLEAGFTAVGEFHYLHHDPAGQLYADPAEMGHRVIAAAAETGIGLSLLPVFYAHSGFGGQAPTAGQRRFIHSLESYAGLLERLERGVAALPGAQLGLAPHSLRAVTLDELSALVSVAKDRVIHIHIAEQVREVEESIQATGARPVEWLLANAPVGPRWCLVHATHLTDAERRGIAESGAVVGLCPITEANLGDGLFPLREFLDEGGRFGIGTDSNVAISLVQELQLLEYGQRLVCRARNVAATDSASTGMRLFSGAAAGGGQALDQANGLLAPGARADIVGLDLAHPALIARRGSEIIDSWLFAGTGSAIRMVMAGGVTLVRDGHHVRRQAILERWRRTAGRLRDVV
jgi:formimidoylglutamate deiminase